MNFRSQNWRALHEYVNFVHDPEKQYRRPFIVLTVNSHIVQCMRAEFNACAQNSESYVNSVDAQACRESTWFPSTHDSIDCPDACNSKSFCKQIYAETWIGMHVRASRTQESDSFHALRAFLKNHSGV